MKTRFEKRRKETGSLLFITLILTALLGLTLGSYLYWVRTQNVLVNESQAWNSALTIAEAGIEEGMAQINVSVGGADPTNFSASIITNWTAVGSARMRTNDLGYSAIISNDYPPTIIATGYTKVPLVGKPISRTVMVKTAVNALFGIGITSLQNIDMKGNNIYVDAYDSGDLVKFPGGLYNTNYAFAGADVASMGGIISVGNGDIHGRLILAPGASYTIGANGLVGDMPANWPAQSGVESPTSDWVITDFNKDFPDVAAPYSSGLTTVHGTGGDDWLLGNGDYYYSGDMTIQNNKSLTVAAGATARLYVTGSLNGQPNSTITVSNGASLKLYIGGPSSSFGQVNNAGNAYNFQVYGLTNLTSFTISGNGQYIGTLYAPQTVFTLSGGGANTLDYQGACVVKSVTMNGHFNFHYDKNLSRTGPASGYTVSTWREL